MSYFKLSEGRDAKELAPGARTRTFWGDNMLLSLVEIDANALVPRHTHPHEQVGIVVEGGMELGIDGEVQVHQVGDMHIIPGGVKHYARGLDQPCRALDVFSPVREEFKY